MIAPPQSGPPRRIVELRDKLEASMDTAIRAAQERGQWPATAQIPADCHEREVKKYVFDAYRAQGWILAHGMGTSEVQIRPPPPRR